MTIKVEQYRSHMFIFLIFHLFGTFREINGISLSFLYRLLLRVKFTYYNLMKNLDLIYNKLFRFNI